MKPIDPNEEERLDQRIGNWIVVLAYLAVAMALTGLVALTITAAI